MVTDCEMIPTNHHVWSSLMPNLIPIAAGVFGGYLAITALLITLAITRHDNLIPLSRSISGRYNAAFAIWEFLSFVYSIISTFWHTKILFIPIGGEFISLGITIFILWRAMSAAMNPRKYELIALRLAQSNISSRVKLAFSAYASPSTVVSNRGKVSTQHLQSTNNSLRSSFSKREGMVKYRKLFLHILEWTMRCQPLPNRAWLAQNSGAYVRTGDTLRIAIPRSMGSLLCALAIKVVPFDIDFWEHIEFTSLTSYFNNDYLTYQRTVDLFLTAFRQLGQINNGNGVTYKDMWPQIGCDEVFQIGLHFEKLVKSIARPGGYANQRDAGYLVLRLASLAIERNTCCQLVRYVLDRLKDEKIELQAEELGQLILKQGFYIVEETTLVWSAIIKYWINDHSTVTGLVNWLIGCGISASSMGKSTDILGAIILLTKAEESSDVMKSYVGAGAQELAARIYDEMPA